MGCRMTDSETTVTIDGDERDVFIRGFINIAPDLGVGGGWGAEVDGDIQVRIAGDWWPVDSVNLDDGDLERIEQSLCDKALEDDSDECLEYPEYEDA